MSNSKGNFRRLLVALSVAGAVGWAHAGEVSVAINAEKTNLKAVEDIVLNVSIRNQSSQPQFVLKYQLPSASLEAPVFEVLRNGVPVSYTGKLVKRGQPTVDDYVLLKPGQSLQQKIELSSQYDFKQGGQYSIRYVGAESYSATAQGLPNRSAQVDGSGVVSIFRDGSAKAVTPLAQSLIQSAEGSITTTQCSASQIDQINSAYREAQNLATDSEAYLSAGNKGARYTTWFGTYNLSRYSTVKEHFAAIKDGFFNKPVNVNCGCNDPYYAYVYADQAYTIYVCKAFWTAPLTGTDSKAGTLIHELSHFNVVAKTRDNAYGHGPSKSLAKRDPVKAIANADSHEYFAENTPAQQ